MHTKQSHVLQAGATHKFLGVRSNPISHVLIIHASWHYNISSWLVDLQVVHAKFRCTRYEWSVIFRINRAFEHMKSSRISLDSCASGILFRFALCQQKIPVQIPTQAWTFSRENLRYDFQYYSHILWYQSTQL